MITANRLMKKLIENAYSEDLTEYRKIVHEKVQFFHNLNRENSKESIEHIRDVVIPKQLVFIEKYEQNLEKISKILEILIKPYKRGQWKGVIHWKLFWATRTLRRTIRPKLFRSLSEILELQQQLLSRALENPKRPMNLYWIQYYFRMENNRYQDLFSKIQQFDINARFTTFPIAKTAVVIIAILLIRLTQEFVEISPEFGAPAHVIDGGILRTYEELILQYESWDLGRQTEQEEIFEQNGIVILGDYTLESIERLKRVVEAFGYKEVREAGIQSIVILPQDARYFLDVETRGRAIANALPRWGPYGMRLVISAGNTEEELLEHIALQRVRHIMETNSAFWQSVEQTWGNYANIISVEGVSKGIAGQYFQSEQNIEVALAELAEREPPLERWQAYAKTLFQFNILPRHYNQEAYFLRN